MMEYKEEKYIDSDGQELIKTIWDNGAIEYISEQGKRHRLDGPAIVYKDGKEDYYLNGKKLLKKK